MRCILIGLKKGDMPIEYLEYLLWTLLCQMTQESEPRCDRLLYLGLKVEAVLGCSWQFASRRSKCRPDSPPGSQLLGLLILAREEMSCRSCGEPSTFACGCRAISRSQAGCFFVGCLLPGTCGGGAKIDFSQWIMPKIQA